MIAFKMLYRGLSSEQLIIEFQVVLLTERHEIIISSFKIKNPNPYLE